MDPQSVLILTAKPGVGLAGSRASLQRSSRNGRLSLHPARDFTLAKRRERRVGPGTEIETEIEKTPQQISLRGAA